MQPIHYFSAANSPSGFYSYFSDILPPQNAKRRILIKGGPGTGKSSLMRKVATLVEKHGYKPEFLHCSSDPDSLDGLVVRKLGFCMLDGTAPHVTDPAYPGAVDRIIDLGKYWDAEKLSKNRSEIEALFTSVSASFSGAYAYLRAAAGVQDYIDMATMQATDEKMLKSQTNALLDKIKLNGHGQIQRGFISALTPKGQIDFTDTLLQKADKVIVVHAESMLAAIFFNQLAARIEYNNIPARLFYCPMRPQSKIEHIYLPEDGICITTSNAFHKISTDMTAEHIDLNVCASPTPALRADTDLLNLLLSRAIACLRTAKLQHDKLESYYIPHMNFDRMQELPEQIVSEIL